MGVNVYIRTKEGDDHPDWDWMRQSGDRMFWDVCKPDDFETWTPDGFPYEDDTMLYRPKACKTLADAPWPDEYSKRRYTKAAGILEANPDYWLEFIY